MAGEPTEAEVLAWMRRTGRTPADAVDQFWPGCSLEDRARIRARVKTWLQRARKRGDAPPATPAAAPNRPPPPAEPGPLPPPPPVDLATARQDPVALLERRLAETLADREAARTARNTRDYLAFDKRVSELVEELQKARELAIREVRIERTAGAIASALLRRARVLNLIAERERRNNQE